MIKRVVIWILVVLIITAALGAWKIFGSGTSFDEKSKYFYIPTHLANSKSVDSLVRESGILKNPAVFHWLAGKMDYWTRIKPGRYQVLKGMSVMDFTRMLRNGRQSTVNLVINKFRTREDFARYAGRLLECDSVEILKFLNNADSLANFGLDTNNVMTVIIPNTYTFYWNTTASKLFKRLYSERQSFWTPERKAKADSLGLSPGKVYILASLVEEETNQNSEKPLIASVYLNRLKRNMPLAADPTVKFALRDFAIKRILLKHIDESAESPYNTYRHAGLPPGPICTPSIKTLDAVLETVSTDYLFFCAKPDFSGYHAFASTATEHFRNARAYQRALDSLLIK